MPKKRKNIAIRLSFPRQFLLKKRVLPPNEFTKFINLHRLASELEFLMGKCNVPCALCLFIGGR